MNTSDNDKIDLTEIELQLIFPLGGDLPNVPYKPHDSISMQIQQTVRAIRRAIELKDRLNALVNAFYLGQLFNKNVKSVSEKFARKKDVNQHYVTIADRIYNVFESNPACLMGTTTIKFQDVKYWKKFQVLRYREIIEQSSSLDFAGAQNLEGEAVNR